MSYDEFKETYNQKDSICGKIGRIYLAGDCRVVDVGCNKWTCLDCRPYKKFALYLEVVRNVLRHELDFHFVITFPGKLSRNTITWLGSYRYMLTRWNSFKQRTQRDYGKFDYIIFPRAQRDGYCHLHILLNKKIKWSYLNEKRKKYGLGFTSDPVINTSVADYLCRDFFKSHEWKIPPHIRRYSSSRTCNIVRARDRSASNDKFFTYKMKIREISQYIKQIYDVDFDPFDYYFERIVRGLD